MSTPQDTSISFFGATGGCTISALVPALKAGYVCSALVRSRTKLEQLLRNQGISQEIQNYHLRIVTGNATDVSSVAETLRDPSGKLASIIVSGVGGAPKFTPNPLRPTLDQPNICQDTVKAIAEAVVNLRRTGGLYAPYIVAISTTGVDDSVDDVPWLMHPLYHWLLPIPHKDKRLMEEAVSAGAKEGVFSHYTIVRPSLLTDGASAYDSLKAGYSKRAGGAADRWNPKDGEAIGYTVSRIDVGTFVFEELISHQDEGEWRDRKVTLTY